MMHANQVGIYLGFHGLGTTGKHVPDSEVPYWLPLDRYRAILDIVANAPNCVGLTFDDGNASDLEVALPALQMRGLFATFFVVSDRIGKPGYLDVSGIRTLDAAGMGIGSHGASHVRWTELAEADIIRHVASSLAVLGGIVDRRIDSVAVPFGAYDRRVLAAVREAGVRRAYTSDCGPVVRRSWLVPRNTIRFDTPLEEIKALVSRLPSLPEELRARARLFRRSHRRHRRALEHVSQPAA